MLPFRRSELCSLSERFDHRSPSSRWCGFGTIGSDDPNILILFTNSGGRCFLASRFDDGIYELRTPDRTLIGCGPSLDHLIALLDPPITG